MVTAPVTGFTFTIVDAPTKTKSGPEASVPVKVTEADKATALPAMVFNAESTLHTCVAVPTPLPKGALEFPKA